MTTPSLAMYSAALMVAAFSAHAEEALKNTKNAVYYSDDSNCNASERIGLISGHWNGRSWVFVAPDAIDTSAAWQKKYGTGLHVRPLEVIRSEVDKLGTFVEDADHLFKEDVDARDGDARFRLIATDPRTVPQEFSGSYRYASVAVRMCVRRKGAWESIRYVSTRAVKGKMELWHSQSKSAREKDFTMAFQVAMHSALEWASKNVDDPWAPGTIVRDPVYGW